MFTFIISDSGKSNKNEINSDNPHYPIQRGMIDFKFRST